MQAEQVRLTRDLEYNLEDRWIKVERGTQVNFCEEGQYAFVANENELFFCCKEYVEPIAFNKLFIVPSPDLNAASEIPLTNKA